VKGGPQLVGKQHQLLRGFSALGRSVENGIQIVILWLNDPSSRGIQVWVSPILIKNEKVDHYIRIKIHKFIVLKFWIESGVNAWCD